jgi:hypothetical protein
MNGSQEADPNGIQSIGGATATPAASLKRTRTGSLNQR